MTDYSVGSLVKFRGREWVLMTSPDKDVFLLRPLTGAEQDSCGIFLPLEGRFLEPATFPLPTTDDIGDFESARLLRNAARLLLRHGAGPFRSMGQLAFRPRPYQFVPLLMALRLNPVRMLIADDVGVGKTIEAAMIARELLDRGEARRLAVICPPYLCDQWRRELFGKFNIDAKIVGTNTFARLERDLPRKNLSVFEYYPHIIASVDFVKAQSRRDAFLLHCPDLVIVDEAHGCAKPAGQSVAQQQRHQLIFDLAKDETKHVILVTATPHSGFDEPFLSLLGFIRPSFGKLDWENLQESQRVDLAHHFIQRRRADVEQWMGAETSFPEREPLEVSYRLSTEYTKLFQDIYRFAREIVIAEGSEKGFRRRVRYWAALALLRCVMSSPAAARTALLERIERLTGDEDFDGEGYSPYILDPADAERTLDLAPSHVVGEEEASADEPERRKLREFARRAEGLKGDSDTKIKKAAEMVKSLLREGFRPIVFCRYIATSDYLAEELKTRLGSEFPGLQVISITGAVSDEEREIRVEELGKSARHVLVATDCLSEGVNLQEHFDAVIHYDLPWNPNRLEQREGRVDRFGQQKKKVKAVLLYGADNPIDGAVLDVLLRKARRIHKELGIMVPIPVDSESVMETVLKALFLRSEGEQMDLFRDGTTPVVEVHREWDRAAEKERKSRTRFAQHAIKPDEVAKELDVTDKTLGDSADVERFVRTACQRLGSPVSQSAKGWSIDISRLPTGIHERLPNEKLNLITFDENEISDATYISRLHPLTNTLAEYLLDIALDPEGDRMLSARCGVTRSGEVKLLTTLLILRLRFLVKDADSESPLVAEECVIAGYRGGIEDAEWLPQEEVESLFDRVKPSAFPFDQAKHWVEAPLRGFDALKEPIRKLAQSRATELEQAYGRVRSVIKGKRASITPVLPADVLAVMVIVPQPG